MTLLIIKDLQKQGNLPFPVKNFFQTFFRAKVGLSNIAAALSRLHDDTSPAVAFLPTLRQAIERFGALSDFTLRRLGRFELKNDAQLQKFLEQVELIRQKLGNDYLADLNRLSASNKSEIIVAVEVRNAF